MSPLTSNSTDYPHVIVGAGIIGLSIGWRLLREGAEHVEIFEAGEAGRSSAAWVAAGMLSPRAEAGFEDLDIYEEGLKSLDLYPRFLHELSEDVGEMTPNIDRCGTLVLAVNADQSRELDRQFDFRKRAGIPVQKLSGDEVREREPLLSTKVTRALWLEADAQINNRKLLLALKAAFLKRGGILREASRVSEIVIRDGRAVAVRFGDEEAAASSITIAAGAWSSKIGGLTPSIPVRPVKGQMIGLRMTPQSRLQQPVRTSSVYLVPKDDGRLLVGATAEEVGFDKRIIAGNIMELLHHAWEIMPAIYELEIEELLASFRPAARDHRAIEGPSEIKNLFYATGHWRHGILMAPLAAKTLSKIILEKYNADGPLLKEEYVQ
ncbi:MAG TPA: glycine oxidase ThiO [Candidatus Kapabacteria bacterium]|nr:glycine oxidase ThiO [Candidatus Kapabacteria bacterium]